MTLAHYEPWNMIPGLQDEMNRLFNRWSAGDSSSVTAEWIPAVDVEEYKDRFELYIDLPGVDPANVDITLENDILTLSGSRAGHELAEKDRPLQTRTERGHGKFYRRFILPNTVDIDAVKATGRNGVLEISIPKQAKAQPRRIEVAA